jgi:hypothetical protein
MFRTICRVAIAAALAGSAHSALAAAPAAPAATPNPAKLDLPDLSASASAADEADFDKYFYFHRADTTFEQALTDIRECDGYARGLASPFGYQEAGYPYAGTMAGAVGGAIGNLMVAMIFGSAELRKARRTNMRRCMNYKGYDRFGLNKDVWQQFNFEEGLSHVAEDKRQAMLAQQAKAASIIQPAGRILGR